MHLPWIQVDKDAIEKCKRMARFLSISEAHGIGIGVAAWNWALEIAPPGDFSGRIPDVDSLSIAVYWPINDAQRLAKEMQRSGLIATIPALRVRGLDRYREAWLRNHRATYKRRKSDSDPRTTPVQPPYNPQPQTQTQTQTHTTTPPTPPAAQGGLNGKSGRRPRRANGHAANGGQSGHDQHPPSLTWDAGTAEGQAFKGALEVLRRKGEAYAASQIERMTPSLESGVLVLSSADAYFGHWVRDHYADVLSASDRKIEVRCPPLPELP